jgi:CRP/FNR family cyclic AMP-dependent transcriptional regulator
MVDTATRLSIYGCGNNETPVIDWNGFRGNSAPLVHPQGAELLQQDCTIRAVHLIHDGMVKLLHLTSDGKAVIVGLRTSGSLLGAAQALLGQPSPLTAVAAVRTETSIIPTGRFRDLFAADAAFCASVGKAISQNAHQDTMLAIELSSCDARVRLEHFLREFAKPARNPQTAHSKLQLPLTHGELAQLLGITPQHLSCLFAKLERQGVLRRRNGMILMGEAKQQSQAGRRQSAQAVNPTTKS